MCCIWNRTLPQFYCFVILSKRLLVRLLPVALMQIFTWNVLCTFVKLLHDIIFFFLNGLHCTQKPLLVGIYGNGRHWWHWVAASHPHWFRILLFHCNERRMLTPSDKYYSFFFLPSSCMQVGQMVHLKIYICIQFFPCLKYLQVWG